MTSTNDDELLGTPTAKSTVPSVTNKFVLTALKLGN